MNTIKLLSVAVGFLALANLVMGYGIYWLRREIDYINAELHEIDASKDW
jgi:hypothetical protein